MLNAWVERRRAKRVELLGGQAWLDALSIIEDQRRATSGIVLYITDAKELGFSDLDFYIQRRFKHK